MNTEMKISSNQWCAATNGLQQLCSSMEDTEAWADPHGALPDQPIKCHFTSAASSQVPRLMVARDALLCCKSESDVKQFLRGCAVELPLHGQLELSFTDFFRSPEQPFLFSQRISAHGTLTVEWIVYFERYVLCTALTLISKLTSPGSVQPCVRPKKKLRLSEGFVIDSLCHAGFILESITNENGIITALATKEVQNNC